MADDLAYHRQTHPAADFPPPRPFPSTHLEQLPVNALAYVKRIEALLEIPIDRD